MTGAPRRPTDAARGARGSPLIERFQGHVAGRWADADRGASLEVLDPATGELLARVPDMGERETAAAVEAADRSLDRPAPAGERRRWLEGIRDGLLEDIDGLSLLITLENGKPLRESRAEVEYAARFFGFFAWEMGILEPEVLEDRIRGCRWTVHRRPAGVAALITPWNFPLAMLAKKLSAALAAGCPVVVKPAELTPLSAIALWHILERLGIPLDGCGLVIGRPGPIGEILCTHPAVRLLSFTGSTEVGSLLLARTAPHIKRLALELGGNAPFIVLGDADPRAAAEALVANKFRAGGQTCVCANRVLVERGILDAFSAEVAGRVKALRVGNGRDPSTDVGPLIHRDAFDRVAALVRDAVERGARRLAGGDPPRPAGDRAAFYPPTVLLDVTESMRIYREEIFGPVVAVATFVSDDEALALANGTEHGLAAYVFTSDPGRADRFVERLRFGHVGVNTGTGPTPEAPFGGRKRSGFGREGGADGLLEFTETQVVAVG